ncbi:upf0136 membrane protein at2g26240 [Phtheirospermum japonicum]|uniref:Upf0136 membrane protein at2g26240 n=1 Tax=Phtheirospermum japonicum TaxID=374723 RepID=A0A830CSM3_9LAMI|nr:upf0136 membrane protein at2g26240 [Phtheirospermum japonicum]
MVEILALSQSSLLLSSRPSPLCTPRRARLVNFSRASLPLTSPANLSPTKPITFSSSHVEQNSIRTRVISDSKVPTTFTVDSAGGGIDILPDSGGPGDNPGGAGGNDGGGGGGDGGGGENDKNEDEGGAHEEKTGMSMSQKLTLGYAASVGIGGLMGYLKGGSTKSLIAGGVSASILYFVYTLLPVNPVLASCVGGVLSATLLGVMGLRFKKSGKVFPAGVVALMSLVMSGGYLHGILRCLH